MGGSFTIGRAFGIDLKVHWTFFLLLAFFAFAGYQGSGSLTNALITTVVILALFLCVVLHELGHSLVAQRLGIEIKDITLLPIGGVARLTSLPERPMDEVKIAAAGPLVNVVLAPIFFAIGIVLGASPLEPANILQGGNSVGQIFAYLGLINVALVLFNLIPAFPMDGGRVLRGLLASRLGAVRATDISSAVGQFFAIGFFLIGLLSGNFLLALVAVFIFFGASGEAQMVRQRELMRGLLISDVMGTRSRLETVTPYHTFGQVLDSIIHGYQEDFPVVDEDGRLVGMITRNEIMAAAHSPERYSSVRDLMRTDFPTLSPEADLFTDGARILQESGLRALPVVKAGELVGMLTMDDIGQAALLRDPRKRVF
ncbi:MAG TPA: site-2 protease family protein [Rubrobacteraceae bacterium]|jgi:Zn-dependent protease/CBS domain-containing protein|nr:site-2 protease family protein [Rubrobacteraceae bacterium]